MKVLIVEDEYGVAQNLSDILQELETDIEILDILESVEEVVDWVRENPPPELGFFDIRLADGISFEIFKQVKIEFPVIFTTAYDEFALKAFKVNSIDYLLKPIDKEAIRFALNKYRSIYKKQEQIDMDRFQDVITQLGSLGIKKFKKSFLVYFKDKIIPVPVKDIAFFCLQNELIYCFTTKQKKHIIDQSLEQIMTQVDPDDFFRANRQIIVSRKSIQRASQYFNRKLVLELNPQSPVEVIISKTRAKSFKEWLGG